MALLEAIMNSSVGDEVTRILNDSKSEVGILYIKHIMLIINNVHDYTLFIAFRVQNMAVFFILH